MTAKIGRPIYHWKYLGFELLTLFNGYFLEKKWLVTSVQFQLLGFPKRNYLRICK